MAQRPTRTESAWIITGVPGAGKTTTGRRLAERLPRSAFIEGDSISDLVVGGHLRPEDEPSDEAERQLDLSVRNQALLARSFFDAGFSPVIEWIVMSHDRLLQYAAVLDDRPLRFVVLAPTAEVALQRHHSRGKYVADRWLFHLHEPLQRMRDVGLWLDNSSLSVDEVVDLILTREDAALVDVARLSPRDRRTR